MDGNRFLKDYFQAKEKFPQLNYEYLGLFKYPHKVSCDFEIIDHEENHWGTFRASIFYHYTYPKGFAILKDESNAFPWVLDWHIDEKSGQCCVCGPVESAERSSTGITVLSFINDYAIPFYANQIYKKEYGQYKNGEYSHFKEGVWEALEEEFLTSDRNQIIDMLGRIKIKRGRNAACFCGSGIKYKKCHLHRIKFIIDLVNKSELV